MKKATYSVLIVLLVSIYSCQTNNPIQEKESWAPFYTEQQLNGTFVLYNLESKQYSVYNQLRADSQYPPASTFKIFNSLVSLQEGVVDEKTIVPWDSVDRGWDAWNHDMWMEEAFPFSCVWYYQEIARRVGEKRMQHWLDTIGYGNQTMGAAIDLFWLDGDLSISANQQISFLDKLYHNELAFDTDIQERVKRLMIADSTDQYQVYAKTGWAMRINRQIGWYVGFVETAEGTWLFANNIDIKSDEDLKYRKLILYEILNLEGIIQTQEI